MQAKYVVITEMKTGQTKNKSDYTYILDQDKVRWNLFNNLPKVELNKSYLFRFEIEGEYTNVKSIEPLTNIFHQKALQEVANKSEIWRNYSVTFSYAKDLCVAGKIELGEMFNLADKIYDKFTEKTNNETKPAQT